MVLALFEIPPPQKKRKKETQKFGDLAGRALHQLPERGVIYTS